VIVCFPYFLCLPDAPTSSSSSPASRSAALHRRAPLRPVATEVRTPLLPSCGCHGHRAEAERLPLRAATPPLVMPAIEPGWDTISCRCRRLHQHARVARLAYPPLAVGRRPVSVATAPCRRARVAFTTRESSRARPCEPRRPRPGVHPSTRAPQPWRQGRAFGPFSCLRRRSPQCLGRPCRRDPAVAMWVVHMVAKRRGRHVLGHPEHTAVHPRRVRANQPRAPRSPPPMASSRAPP
jgi:hypothetical protein